MEKQTVYLGTTQSGVKGLFTAGTLVMPLRDEQWDRFNASWQELDSYCYRMGFVPVGGKARE